jgi:hypothetical protein
MMLLMLELAMAQQIWIPLLPSQPSPYPVRPILALASQCP